MVQFYNIFIPWFATFTSFHCLQLFSAVWLPVYTRQTLQKPARRSPWAPSVTWSSWRMTTSFRRSSKSNTSYHISKPSYNTRAILRIPPYTRYVQTILYIYSFLYPFRSFGYLQLIGNDLYGQLWLWICIRSEYIMWAYKDVTLTCDSYGVYRICRMY